MRFRAPKLAMAAALVATVALATTVVSAGTQRPQEIPESLYGQK